MSATEKATEKIPFNKVHLTSEELENIKTVLQSGKMSGDGSFTKQCHQWLESELKVKKALLTHSCTAALEMAAILLNLQAGDEVILPSYTFVSTANAIVLRGATPVFVDVEAATMNIDLDEVEKAFTARTKAIFVVHYGGVCCDMDRLLSIAQKHSVAVVEDAAQGIMATYKGKPLGTFGAMSCLSFHETKNIISGEGGALLINDAQFVERAEIIREKGTNRSLFFRGEVDKYTWVDVGSSYLPSELIAATLLPQLKASRQINAARVGVWQTYHRGLQELENSGHLLRPQIPPNCITNAHIYHIITRSLQERGELMEFLKKRDIYCVFHYVPLHSSPAGIKYGRSVGSMKVTNEYSDRLLRLPVWADLQQADRVVRAVHEFFKK